MMNFINRILIILQLFLAIALTPILIVLLLFARPTLENIMTGLVHALISGPNPAFAQAICVGLAALVFIIALLFLFLELQRPRIKRLKVQEVMGGQVEVTVDAIVHRLEYVISQIADVTRVRPRVVATKKGNVVDLGLEVETNPDVNVPQKTQEIITAARQVMEERTGLKVGKIEVRLDHARKIQKQKPHGGRENQPPQQSQISG